MTKLAFDEGIFINPVIPPACAPQDTLVRVALMATHTKEQVDYAVDKLTKCFKKLEIINKISQVAFVKATCFYYVLLSIFVSVLLEKDMNRIKGILYAAVSSATFGLAPFFP